jgi:hypothetical protein
MDLTSGIFTAPRPGTYFFSFSAIAGGGNLYIGLYVNGNFIGTGHSSSAWQTLTLQSTIHLNAGDKVYVQIWDGVGYLHEYGTHRYTHFSGWLLEENLSS